jgi:hypothetical protein
MKWTAVFSWASKAHQHGTVRASEQTTEKRGQSHSLDHCSAIIGITNSQHKVDVGRMCDQYLLHRVEDPNRENEEFESPAVIPGIFARIENESLDESAAGHFDRS